ncbi:N-acetylmuramoyl-L-alanine amidase [Marinicrinis sediminis]|uniref:N-acetylmuramoyl-L-alanine amidase n=1 Tax=Marinicrinis sediminis TaxID=1652465 RepID=A0ABW5R806_9BACL
MKIAIDAGHGPHTAGKRCPDGSLREFFFNHATATYLGEALLQYEGVEILYPYQPNTDTPLRSRTDRANDWGADVYISIHANAYGAGQWNEVNGIETFVYKSKPKEAWQLSERIQHELVQATGRKNRGVKTADFHVLRETAMTAVLIECEFMTHRQSCERLKSDAYRRTCASAIAKAVTDYYQLQNKAQTDANDHPQLKSREGSIAHPSANEKRPQPDQVEETAPLSLYKVQVGAYTNPKHAEQMKQALERLGFQGYIVKEEQG